MILVSGATGVLGGRIVLRLLKKGEQVRVLLRHESPAEQMALTGMATDPQTLLAAGATPVYGDLKDRDSLFRVCEGVDTIITTANSAMRGGLDNVDSVDRLGNRNLIEAAKKSGVQQFIFISFLGADLHHPVPLFAAKAETEELLRNNGLTYTILAPNFIIESWAGMVVGIPLQTQQPVSLVGEGRRLHSFIALDDVAAFAVACVGNTAAYNQRIPLGGPAPTSWREIVNTFSQVIGNDIPVRFVKPGESIPGLPDIAPPTLAAMETYDSVIPMEETAKMLGVRQLTLTQAVQKMLGIKTD